MKEVIGLKFGDIVIVVAWLVVVVILIFFPLTLVLPPVLGNYAGYEIGAIFSFIVSPVIVGYIFAQKIWEENRIRTMAKIVVLFTVLVAVTSLVENAVSADWTPMVKENYLNANPNATPSTSDWYYIERLAIIQEDFSVIILVFALSFIGLYFGSTLRKPAKS